jgi:hypothetical protein
MKKHNECIMIIKTYYFYFPHFNLFAPWTNRKTWKLQGMQKNGTTSADSVKKRVSPKVGDGGMNTPSMPSVLPPEMPPKSRKKLISVSNVSEHLRGSKNSSATHPKSILSSTQHQRWMRRSRMSRLEHKKIYRKVFKKFKNCVRVKA